AADLRRIDVRPRGVFARRSGGNTAGDRAEAMSVLVALQKLAQRRRNALALLLIAAATLLGVRAWPRPPLSASVLQSVAVVDRHGQVLRLTLAADQRYRLWTPLEKISPTLVSAVLLHEDAWFYRHPGINPLSLLRGAW